MSENRAGRELVKWVAVTVAVLLLAYVGAYYTLVRRHTHPFVDPAIERQFPLPAYSDVSYFDMTPDEAKAAIRTMTFFTPIHWLDRKFRPQIWDPTP